ncbi:MAG: TraB/GumN family protein [Candidatus Diapherotrites archaeon]|nr:TraB/GumN family protein [Candidatus Diapherotrites archaeon]
MIKESVEFQGKQIILVGTAHVSMESVELVQKTIEEEKPDVVGVELDFSRFNQLKSGKKWREMDITKVISSGQSYLFLINLLLSSLQRELGLKLGVKPGEEMLEAIKIAENQRIPIALLDRDVNITLKRAMNKMTLIEKMKLAGSIFGSFFGLGGEAEITQKTIEELKKTDVMNELMKKLSVEMPSIKTVLVDERDLFIANKILNCPGKKIVAVIGAGHLNGVKKYLDEKRSISQLNEVIKKKNYLITALKFLIPLLIIGLFAYTFLSRGFEETINVFLIWFLVNGIFSALGVIIARGHPLSVLTAFLAAPITSLQPMLAAGWFAGIVEAKFNKPKVKDFEDLNKINSIKSFYSNQFTKVLLVVALANIGSSIGTFVALPIILSVLL